MCDVDVAAIQYTRVKREKQCRRHKTNRSYMLSCKLTLRPWLYPGMGNPAPLGFSDTLVALHMNSTKIAAGDNSGGHARISITLLLSTRCYGLRYGSTASPLLEAPKIGTECQCSFTYISIILLESRNIGRLISQINTEHSTSLEKSGLQTKGIA